MWLCVCMCFLKSSYINIRPFSVSIAGSEIHSDPFILQGGNVMKTLLHIFKMLICDFSFLSDQDQKEMRVSV